MPSSMTSMSSAAAFDIHRDPGGAGIDGVLDELFDNRGRALDDLAGRNLSDGQCVELADGVRHGATFAAKHGGPGRLRQRPDQKDYPDNGDYGAAKHFSIALDWSE